MTALKVFQPDLFSDPLPHFYSMENNRHEAREISALFTGHYKKHGGSPVAIWKSGALEVNSRNFRIDTDRGTVLLKKLSPSANEKPVLENQQALVGWLKNEGIPVPAPILADDGYYLCPSGNSEYWTAMTFVEGRFFTGGNDSVANAARAIGHLHKTLKAAPAALPIDRRYAHLSADDRTLFEEVLTGDPEVLANFDELDARLLEQSREFLQRNWQTVLRHQEIYRSSEAELIHIDLHPHNLLMLEDRVAAFIDFNSLKAGPLNMMLGFSAYKLLRQAVQTADQAMTVANCRALTNNFLDNFYAELPELAAGRDSVGIFALAEVCRRIGIIFHLTLRRRDKTWNHVLKVHLAGIREIELLFGLEPAQC